MRAGEQPRRHQVFHRVGGQGGERVDLVGDAHGADFGRHRRPHPAGDDKPGQHRPQLARDGKHDDVGNGALGRESGENPVNDCSASTIPVNTAVSATTGRLKNPIFDHRGAECPAIEGWPEDVRDSLASPRKSAGRPCGRRRARHVPMPPTSIGQPDAPGCRGGRLFQVGLDPTAAQEVNSPDRPGQSGRRAGSGPRSRWCRPPQATIIHAALRGR